MVERKVKSTNQRDGGFKGGKRKNLGPIKKKGKKDEARDKRPRRGPRLPNALQRELGNFKRAGDAETSDVDEEIDSDEEVIGNDVYEYEEGVPEEESMKNRRFDPVENYEYELSENFEDYKVSSGSEDDDDLNEGDNEDEDEGKHSRMLEEITGLPSDAFGGKKKKDFFVSEAYPESEFNPTGDILDGRGQITIEDLLEPLQGKPGFSKLRKSLNRLEKKTAPTLAPLPKTEQERLERKVAYEHSKKEITKWEPLVKRNREASTLFFDNTVDLQFSTIGAISSDFEPRTDFEKKMASLVNENEFVEAHNRDGARLLELNKISAEEVKERQERLAKMRSLLFRHELKAKRIKKIKSKTYHRLLKKDKKKAAESAIQMDPESAKAQALKQEFDRLRERMTLKHKNNSKWAKRVLQRGLDVQDEGTREAFAQQLSQHAILTRKQNSMRESSSSDDSSDGDDSDDTSAGSDQDMASKLITKAKEKTLKVLEGDEELPMSGGVLSLNFMKRGLKKRSEAANEEARRAVEEYESSLKQLEDKSAPGSSEKGSSSGRMVFGAPKKVVKEKRKIEKMNNYYGNSDSEDDVEAEEDNVIEHNNQNDKSLIEADIDPNILREEFDIAHDSVFQSFGGAEDPEPKTTYEVAFMASDKWKKMNQSSGDAIKKDKNTVPKKDRVADAIKEDRNIGRKKKKVTFETMEHDIEENDDGDSDSDEEMVDGILSSGLKSTYELPSQAELIQRAFAGDDVEEDFKKDKEEILDEENPQPEKPALIPGWGEWTDVQKKRGLPLWMVKEHETAKKQRMEALKKRKDAHLNNVIISEKVDKKAEKLHTKTLPYPYTSKEVFEQSIRMPIGPEFNPATTLGALNRPEVVKRPGHIIQPISYEDMNVRERAEIKKHSGQKPKNAKNNNSRPAKKSTTKV